MSDKEFLEKIKQAYKHYPNKDLVIEKFISWLYKTYGYHESQK